jgi:hypothetical protein
MMLGGFHFKETMAGTWRREGSADERGIRFTVVARAASLLQHLRDHKATLTGTVQMDGFASDAPLDGELTINPLFGRVIRYEFAFTADDGKPYRLRGQKDVAFTDLARTMTTLPAEIVDADGQRVATANLLFDKKDLPRFLASFRPG